MKNGVILMVGILLGWGPAQAGEPPAVPILAEVSQASVAAPVTGPAPAPAAPAVPAVAATSPFAKHFDQLLSDAFQPPDAPTANLMKVPRPLPSSIGISASGSATSLFQGIPTDTLSLPTH